MSKFLLDIAFEKGFKLILGKHLDYSTMRVNGICSIYEDNQGRQIIWGLHEYKKPPTLIYPRPNILKYIMLSEHPYISNIKFENDKRICIGQQYDDVVNQALKEIDNELLFEAMFDKSIIIKLN